MQQDLSRREQLEHDLKHVSHLLPAQGPIGVFIHHNTLHAFQHLPFEQAVEEAAQLFEAEPYMSERAYRAALVSGRIHFQDVDCVVAQEGGPYEDLKRAMLVPGIRVFRPETISWEIEEHGLLDQYRSDLSPQALSELGKSTPRELFDFCLAHTSEPEDEGMFEAARVRDGVLAASGVDLDDTVHPLLIKLSSAFLDQGLAYWPMPNREEGFWKASLQILQQPLTMLPASLERLPALMGHLQQLNSADAILSILDSLGVNRGEQEGFLQSELLALPGWAGLMHQLESDPSLAPHEAVPASLMDFVAVRLMLTLAATQSLLNHPKDWRMKIMPKSADRHAARLAHAARFFDAAQLMGLSAQALSKWPLKETEDFQNAVEAFDDLERRRVLHLAYERHHERQILIPLRKHAELPELAKPVRLAAQVFFCIDEREESIRRHLEEVDPEIETLSAAGFYGVAMNYKGMDDAHGVSLCPVVVKPQHAVLERPSEGHQDSFIKRLRLRRLWARSARESFLASRTLVRGWLGTTVLGIFSIFPLAARVLSPRRYGKWMEWLNSTVLPEPRTELTFMRKDEASHVATEGLVRGFTVPEKADRVASVLGPAGLHKAMAKIVVVLGHGSTSLNNPHESAHDCGACGGRRGGPNGRIFAAMANHPLVRAALKDRGIHIPEDTWFVGGYHDTCNDNIDLYDLEDVPETHRGLLARVRESLDQARTCSAHERARRFEAASPSLDTVGGLHHVQERAEHLAEPRPEYGHCTNAVCIVGRRSTTRGLFMDRRAFLVSYDATLDPDNSALGQLLGAVIPVCAGISLEYYFSYVDNEGYGCGTKLPHNVTGLVGVMNGYESDLRTGLPWQMVEIHEPVRILFVIESTPDRIFKTIRQSSLNWEFLSNRWIRLAAQDPIDPTIIHIYRGEGNWERLEGDEEVLHHAPSSIEWYRGHIEHLPIARIGRATTMTIKGAQYAA
jgi:uncharacterized protein YbcC (UPF0753/DUF2309 family)